MKLLALASVSVLVAAGVNAQTDNNVEEISNRAYLILSATKHATTQRAYLYPMNVPVAYVPTVLGGPGGSGVAAGTTTWRHVHQARTRRGAPRQFSGCVFGVAASASTTVVPVATAYAPEFSVYPTVLNGAGPNRMPDYTVAPVFQMAQASLSITTATGFYVVTRTLATPINALVNDAAISIKWRGGEADDIPSTQGFWGDYEAGLMSGQTVFGTPGTDLGWATPAPASVVSTAVQAYPGFTSYWDFTSPFLAWMEEEATLIPWANWGFRRDAANPTLIGTNLHVINSDLATTAGTFGWDIFAGNSQGGNYFLMFMNIAPTPWPLSLSLLGQTLELNLFDPAFNLGSDLGYTGTLNASGKYQPTVGVSLPAIPGLVGQYIGAEVAIIASTLQQVNETSGAVNWRCR